MRTRYGDSGIFSYYDYQAGRFHKRQGMRIDLVLASESLAARSVLTWSTATVEKEPSHQITAQFSLASEL